jgi:hypothetical protein
MESWQARRRAVVERAVELGIWPGPVAAQIAVSEGMARSRKELAARLQRHFAALLEGGREATSPDAGQGGEGDRAGGVPALDLDERAVRDNWKSLKAESRALGLPPAEWALPRSEPIMSESEPVASGTIGLFGERAGEGSDVLPGLTRLATALPGMGTEAGAGVPAGGDDAGGHEDDSPTVSEAAPIGGARAGEVDLGGLARLDEAELVAGLDDRNRRVTFALELCRRGHAGAAPAVFAALDGFSRAESGLVLGSITSFGRAAEPHLLAGLRSRKAFLRQGAALALALMKSEAGVEAICDLLLDEPSEMWREVARALGETGAMAVMPLAARLAERAEGTRERAAWALAHIAARGARRPLETLAGGRDPIAAGVARHALELVELATSDNLSARGERAPRDQTLNRAFSRRFFEAVREARRAAAEALAAAEAVAEGSEDAAAAPARVTTARTLLLDTAELHEVMEADDEMQADVAGADPPDESDIAPG